MGLGSGRTQSHRRPGASLNAFDLEGQPEPLEREPEPEWQQRSPQQIDDIFLKTIKIRTNLISIFIKAVGGFSDI